MRKILTVAIFSVFLFACGDVEVSQGVRIVTTQGKATETSTTTTTYDLRKLAPAVEAFKAWTSTTTTTTTTTTKGAVAKVRVGGRICARGCIPAQRPCVIPVRRGVDVCRRESGYLIDVYNPSEDASGKYQFIRSTWSNYRGYRNAADAPEWVQDEKATQLWAGGAGCSHWSHC